MNLKPIEFLENIEEEACDFDLDTAETLLELCNSEIMHWKYSAKIFGTDSIILDLWIKGCTDAEISEGLNKIIISSELSPDAVKKRRQRLIYRISKLAGVDLGLITVLHEAFKK